MLLHSVPFCSISTFIYSFDPFMLCLIRTVIDIHFFAIQLLTFLLFDSDYFDSIFKNCTNRIFSHIPQYFCGRDPKILTMQRQ